MPRQKILTDEEQMMVKGVAARMEAARKDAKMGREEMAYRLGVDFSTIGRWERGELKEGPPLWAVWGYGRLTATSAAELLGEEPGSEALQTAILSALRERMTRFDKEFVELQRLIDRASGGDGNAQGM